MRAKKKKKKLGKRDNVDVSFKINIQKNVDQKTDLMDKEVQRKFRRLRIIGFIIIKKCVRFESQKRISVVEHC